MKKKSDQSEKNKNRFLSCEVTEDLKNTFSRLSKRKKEIDDRYDQSIAAIRDWEDEQNKKLDAVEEQIELRYGGTVIDTEQMELQKKLEEQRNAAFEKQKQKTEKFEALSHKIDNLLKGFSK